jgi:hypothetical protein
MKKNVILISLVVILASVYVIYFTDWFKPKTIQIFHTSRTAHMRHHAGAEPMLILGMNQPFRLTEIKVVPLAAYQANPKTLPLWHLVADSNSVPVKTFHYGGFIQGLKPEVPGTRAEPLTNSITYRLIVVAGQYKGEHDFQLK